MPRKGENLEIPIQAMAYGGRGIGRIEGYVIFVPHTLPGERARVQLTRKKKDYGEARLLDIIEPSPDRVPPPCPYSGHCGGCQWQHIAYETQLALKHEHVRDALVRVGGIRDPRVLPPLRSRHEFAYRNKMEFSFSDRRWFLPGEIGRRECGGAFALGLHVPGTFDKVIDVEACLLQHDEGNAILREVKRFSMESRRPAYSVKTHIGFWRFLTLRRSIALGEWMVNLVTSEEDGPLLSALADRLSSAFTNISSIVNNTTRRKSAVAIGEREVVILGAPHIRDRIGRSTFRVSSNSFFQVNPPAAAALYRQVLSYGEFTGSERVLDLYSGTGTIPIFIADRVAAVTGLELSEDAVRDAIDNCRENGVPNCRFLCGDIRSMLDQLDFRPDVVIADPPRVGMHQDVVAKLLALAPEKIVYVSCNPVTLARDLALLARDYELLEIQPVDLFPQTYHIESVALLNLKKHT